MSYLSYPRLHFSGSFIADPSTINNTPNNYSNENDEIKDLELYWNPNGTGVFDFKECVVTKVVYGPGDEATTPQQDPIIGQTVAAVYAKAPPKIVDLDPDQQNVSELWGLTLQISGIGVSPETNPNFVRGDFVECPFNGIWAQALQGPHSSASGSAVYQSQLKNIFWNTSSSPVSKYLTALQSVSSDQLSLNFVVNSHNNAPVIYAFNETTLAELGKILPADIVAKLKPLTQYIQNVGRTLGDVPTESYVNNELNRLLGQQDAQEYSTEILAKTKKPYNPGNIATPFPFGLVKGTLAPKNAGSNIYYTPTRIMAPPPKVRTSFFAPFVSNSVNNKSIITLDLGNALATNAPGYDTAIEKLGDLTVVYFNQNQSQEIALSNAISFAQIPANINEILKTSAGILDIEVDNSLLPDTVTPEQANANILSMPLGLIGTTSGGQKTILLNENIQGYNIHVDKFVFRMNPGIVSSVQQPRGETATTTFYVTKFGKPASGIEINIYKLNQEQAINYTVGTLGTSGTRGVKNLSVPSSALLLSAPGDTPQESVTLTSDAQGRAELQLTASNPGSPRASQNLDGQIYFIRYNFADESIAKTYIQGPDDLLSVAVHTQASIPTKPSWENCIKNILPQYAKLYPIMGRFRLDDYDSVVQNAAAINNVLSLPITDALHMPVIRDLSIENNNAILQWIANGTPKQ